jgi:hypothetical protein
MYKKVDSFQCIALEKAVNFMQLNMTHACVTTFLTLFNKIGKYINTNFKLIN